MKNLIVIFGTVILLGNYGIAHGQDLHFSQYWMTPLVLNPAHTGSAEDVRIILNYRNQWKSISNPYRTINGSVDMALSQIEGKTGYWAGGLHFSHDKAGTSSISQIQGNLNVAYHIHLGEYSTLGAGIMAGLTSRSIDYSKLQWGSQYDGSAYNSGLPAGEPYGSDKISYFDLGAGIFWKYSRGERYMSGNDHFRANLGAGVFHPHQPKYSFYETGEKLHMKMVFHGDMQFGVPNTNLSIVPGFIFMNQGKLNQINIGTQFRYMLKQESVYTGFESGKAISLGVHFRTKDAIIASMLLEMGPFDIGISYDFNVSKLEEASSGRGGFELGLRYFVNSPFRKRFASRY